MRNQTKYLFIYLFVLCLLIGSVIRLAQAQEQTNELTPKQTDVIELDQAELDQILAPIALYPDTLLSHILVASTYPLEVIQAARWRAVNEDLDERQALEAAEKKDWDPSVQALVPFNQLLQNLSEDLNWLQALGNAFLVNEEQLLTSVQSLRQKAYEQGNLNNNEYVDVTQEEDEIVIQTVRKEVVYVPYYDTRVVYGNWGWHNHQPYYWNRPRHSIFSAGLYWSTGFNIRPSFYFGGFHWRNRHVVANYHYRNHANRSWSNNHNRRQVVRVKEYPRWSHNKHHRQGTKYRVNGQRIVHKANRDNKSSHYKKLNKQRVVNANKYAQKHQKHNAKRLKKTLSSNKQNARHTKAYQANNVASNKQRIVNQSKNSHNKTTNKTIKKNKIEKLSRNNKKPQKYASVENKNSHQKRSAFKTHKKASSNKAKSSRKSSNYRSNASQKQKSRAVKVARNDQSKSRQLR